MTTDHNEPPDWNRRPRGKTPFTPVEESTLAESQRRFIRFLRMTYPTGKAGHRSDGTLMFVASEGDLGGFSGVIPRSS